MAIPYGIDPRTVGPNPAQAGNAFARRMFQPTAAQPLVPPSAGGIMAAAPPQVQGFRPAPPPPPVAARPIQVASFVERPPGVTTARRSLQPGKAGPRSVSDFLAEKPGEDISFVNRNVVPSFSNEELVNHWVKLNGYLDQFRDTIQSERGSPEQQGEANKILSELLTLRDAAVREAAKRGIELPGLPDQAPALATPAAADTRPAAESKATVGDVDALTSVVKAGIDNSLPPDQATTAKTALEQRITALKAAEGGDLKTQMTALLGAETEFNVDNWKQKAKDILEIPADEADVPEWAAPIFLFGLQLMQGPVSSKRQGDSMLMGLAADIGAAGTVAFKDFRAERARKQAQRAQVANLAVQLQTKSEATKTARISAYFKAKTFNLDEQAKVSNTFDKIIRRDLPKSATANQRASYTVALTDAITQLTADGVTSTAILNPTTQALLSSYALTNADLSAPLNMKQFPYAGVNYSYSSELLKKALPAINKARKGVGEAPLNEMGVLTKIIANDSSLDKWKHLVIGKREGGISDDTQTRGGITTRYLINGNLKNKWEADNPDTLPTLADEKTWRQEVESYPADKPEMKKFSWQDENGVKKDIYVDWDAILKKRKTDPKILDKVLKAPGSHPTLAYGSQEDFSNFGKNIQTETVYTMKNGKVQRALFGFDRAAYNKASKAVPSTLPAITADNYKEELAKLGILRRITDWADTGKQPGMFFMHTPDGQVISASGQDASAVGIQLLDRREKEQALHESTNLVMLNIASHNIIDILENANLPRVAMSKSSDLFSAIASGYKMLTGAEVPAGRMKTSEINSRIAAAPGVSAEVKAEWLRAFTQLDKNFTDAGIDNQVTRQRLISNFLNIGYAKASDREKGKLTDADVKLGLKTMGWDQDSWFQSPESVIAGLYEGVRESNEKYITRVSGRLSKEDVDKMATGPGLVNQLLRRQMKLRGQGAKHLPMGRMYLKDPEALLRFDHSPRVRAFLKLREGYSKDSGTSAAAAQILYQGTQLKLDAPPSKEAQSLITTLSKNNVPRNLEGIQIYLETLEPGVRELYLDRLEELNTIGFFD